MKYKTLFKFRSRRATLFNKQRDNDFVIDLYNKYGTLYLSITDNIDEVMFELHFIIDKLPTKQLRRRLREYIAEFQ